jgi:hypothetical protein
MKTKSTLIMMFFIIISICLFFGITNNQVQGAAVNATTSNVKVSFDGMIMLAFGDPTRVSMGFLDVHHHTPRLTITKIKNLQRAVVISREGEQLRTTLNISVEDSPNSTRNSASTSPAISRYYGPRTQASNTPTDPQDFGWTIDFGKLHNRTFTIKKTALFGKIYFSNGLFYGNNLGNDNVRFFAADGSGKTLLFDRQVASPANKITLTEGQTLLISSPNEEIRLLAEPNVSYEIEITSTPPEDMANVDHWLYYYDAVNEKVTRYLPLTVSRAAFAPYPFLCEPVVLEESTIP